MKLKLSKSAWILLIIIAGYVFIISRYFSSVPIWDAWINVDYWIHNAVTKPFNLLNFDNGGHPSFVWMFLLGLLQYVDYGNSFFLHGTVLIFSLLSTIAFRQILKIVFPRKDLQTEMILLTALYIYFPINNANALHINQDYGVLVFFLCLLACMLYKKDKLIVVSALGLVFSKEPGVILYSITLFVFFISHIFEQKSFINVLKSWVFKKWIYILPYILFIARVIIRSHQFPDDVFWVGFNSFNGGSTLLFPTFGREMVESVHKSYFLGIFFIQFNWILTLGMVVGVVLSIFKYRDVVKDSYFNRIYLAIIFVIFIISYTIFTSYITFTNLRYFLPLYSLMIILFYPCLVMLLPKWSKVREVILIIILILFFLSNFRLLDPFTKKVYATFKFGRHDIINMTSTTGECCGYGRDQLVYNLQFLEFGNLQNKIFQDIKPDQNTSFAYNEWNSPEIISRIDKTTNKRTFRISKAFQPKVINWTYSSSIDKPNVIYFIEFPNMENGPALLKYMDQYSLESRKIYEQDGYEIAVDKLKLKKLSL